jgi:hypothetical protein
VVMSYAAVTGRITIPGTDTGIRARLTAVPETTMGALRFPDEIPALVTWGPLVVETDDDGNVPDGFLIPLDSTLGDAVVWRFTVEPIEQSAGPLKRWVLARQPITADITIAELANIELIAITAERYETILEVKADAEDARDDAQIIRDETQALRDGIVGDLGTTDSQTATLVGTPSLTSTALAATTAAAITAAVGAPGVFPTGLQLDGDSLGVGFGDTGGTKQWQTLATNLGLTYRNIAVTGQTTSEVAVRMGALDLALTKTGNSLATGTAAQTVTLVTTGAWKDLATSWTGRLTNAAGATLDGTLAHNNVGAGWTFTRSTAGSAAFDCTGGVTFHCTENDATRDYFHLIAAGTNNPNAAVADATLAVAVRDFDLMARYCRSGYVIVGLHMQPSDSYVAVKTAFNTVMSNRFGNRWVDVNAYMQTNGLALAGVTPAAQDLIDLGNGRVPTSLMFDNTHPSTAGYTVWRRAIEQQIRTRGYATYGKVPVVATATASVVTVGTPTSTTLPITWTAVTGAVGYKVEYRKTGTTTWLQGPHSAGTSATVQDPVSNDLTSGTQYDIRVTPYNDAGAGTTSATVTGTTTGSAPTLLASDGFGGGSAANLNTQAMDLAAGGSAHSWTTNNANTSRTAGGLAHMAGASFAYTDLGSADHRVTAKFATLPTTGYQSLIARFTDTSNFYQAQVTPAGQVKITKNAATVLAATPLGSVAYTAGQVLELRVVGTSIKAIVAGTTVLSVTDSSLTTGNKAGLNASGACDYDDVVFYDK